MRIVADTNLLVRILTRDDPGQAPIAEAEFEQATSIVVSVSMLCELCWVLSRRYKLPNSALIAAIRGMLDQPKVIAERSAVEAGIANLEAGGDFADGVIAHEGMQLGGAFVSFDRNAVRLLRQQGYPARLPGA